MIRFNFKCFLLVWILVFAANPVSAQYLQSSQLMPVRVENVSANASSGDYYFPPITAPESNASDAGFAGWQRVEPSETIVNEEQLVGPAKRYGRPLKAGFYNDPYYSLGGYYNDPDGRDRYRRDHGNPNTYRNDHWYKQEIHCHPATVVKECRENFPADVNSAASVVRRSNWQ